MNVRIYVEGGGDQRATQTECRRGFREFFGKIVGEGPHPRVVAGGSRNQTFDRFKTALGSSQNAFVVLLVDSEGPVTSGAGAWTHLQARDGWDRPPGATDDQAHMMVQCMEAWLVADRDALAVYYGEGFNPKALPGEPDIEQVPKADVFRALERATYATKTKGPYGKTTHGFDLLAMIDPQKVRQASQRADRLAGVLLDRLR